MRDRQYLQIIRNLQELKHTGYVELSPVKGDKRPDYWQKGSLYFSVDTFKTILPIIREVNYYVDYACCWVLSKHEWVQLIEKLKYHMIDLPNDLDWENIHLCRCWNRTLEEESVKHISNESDLNFPSTKEAYAFCTELVMWLDAHLADNDSLWIIGV